MSRQAADKVVILGCGNVAWHLARQLLALKYNVLVCNHRPNIALKAFANLGCKTATSYNAIADDALYYFVCVSDSAIASASAQITCQRKEALVMHTSGSAALSELTCGHENKGVFYPLQTFSRYDEVRWHTVPLILEVANLAAERGLSDLAKKISPTISFLKGKERLRLHLAAVLVNNFSNALYVAASDLVSKKSNSNFELLMPLIQQTTAKLGRLEPRAAQTGPARRRDKVVMKKHLDLLDKEPDLRKIYKLLSKLIVKQQLHA